MIRGELVKLKNNLILLYIALNHLMWNSGLHGN